jgi:serine/threonine protein kinase
MSSSAASGRWMDNLDRRVEKQYDKTLFWYTKSTIEYVRRSISTLLARRGALTDREASNMLHSLISVPVDFKTIKLLTVPEITKALRIKMGARIGGKTAQGVVFMGEDAESGNKIVLKFTKQERHTMSMLDGWRADMDGMVEGKLMVYLNEVSRLMDIRFAPRFFGQYICKMDGKINTMLIQEAIAHESSHALNMCLSTPTSFLSAIVEILLAISAMHAAGVVHNDLHDNNIRARSRSENVVYQTDRGLRHSVCPFEFVIIDFGRSCIRDSVCSFFTNKMFQSGSRAQLDFVRIATSKLFFVGKRRSTSLISTAIGMLMSVDACKGRDHIRNVMGLISLVQMLSSLLLVWNEQTGFISRPFDIHGNSTYVDMWDATGECVRLGNYMPFATSYYIFKYPKGPRLLDYLPTPSFMPKKSQLRSTYIMSDEMYR